MIKYLIYFFLSVSISLVLTPLVRLIAKKMNIYDVPSARKIHRKPAPLLGGIPIFVSLNLSLLMGFILNNVYIKEFLSDKWKPLILCQVIILLLGIFDDIQKLQPRIKFLIQIFAGSLLLLFGIGIYDISNPFSGGLIHLGLLSIPITILWVVGITNALNMIDGLDGLAAGTSLIVCTALFGISFLFQNIGMSFVFVILAGSILGFLRYNFFPAKIFLGDSGSLLLGFLLAVLSIQGSYKGPTLVAVLVPILALGFPIMETLLSMIRRFLRSMHMVDYPQKNGKFKALFLNGFSMFEADKDHVHHRLLRLGFSQRRAVLILYGLCAALCVFAFLTVTIKNINITLFMGAVVIAFVIGIRSLKYQEFKILESGLLLPLFNFPVVNKGVFQAFFDLFSISLSYYFSFILIFKNFGGTEKNLFIRTLPIVLVIKILIFYLSGLYKKSWIYSRAEDLLNLTKSLVLSSLGSLFVLGLAFGISSFTGILFFLIDFYLAATFIMGYRISYKLVHSLYNRNSVNKGKKGLIYGAGHRGAVALNEIQNNGSSFFSPIGFIDDDISKQGQIFHNCPILGPVEDIEKFVNQNDVTEILVSTDKIKKEKIGKLIDFCKQKGIIMRQFEFRFYEFPQLDSE
jgi:UDP-GlcNAc:undecaprenyl-phosphate GlcNAc-1-phosphate transferase